MTSALVARFPALAALPRASLGSFPTPVERVAIPGAPPFWIKRDDLAAPLVGGNKVRALEFLLAGLGAGETAITVGAVGSTHALATAVHARRLGARAITVHWPQEMNADAAATAARLTREAGRVVYARHPADAYVRALSLRFARRARWVPAGGSTPLGIIGHVAAALEVAEQVRGGALPPPGPVVVPLGTGGTAAGLALGFAIAGLDTTVIGVRVVPRLVANRGRLRMLVSRTARLLERHTGERIRRPDPARLEIVHSEYGGAYGRATERSAAAAAHLHHASGIALDLTYSAKALAALVAGVAAVTPEAVGSSGVAPLFWLTYDARWRAGGVALGDETPPARRPSPDRG